MPKTAAVLGGLVLLASLATGASAADRVRPMGENPLKTDTRAHAAAPAGGIRVQAVDMSHGLGNSLVADTASQRAASLRDSNILFKPMVASEALADSDALGLNEAVRAKLRSISDSIATTPRPSSRLKVRLVTEDGQSVTLDRESRPETAISGSANGGVVSQ